MTGESVRWLILLLVTLAAGGGLYWHYENTRPCVHPISYSIGSIDPRFGVSKATLISDLSKAATIWNSAIGKTLFTYSATGTVPVNFVYDERQKNAALGAQISDTESSQDAKRALLNAEHAQLSADEDAFNAKVDAVNRSGGATPAQREELRQEQNALVSRQAALNAKIDAFNASVRAINAQVDTYNQGAGDTFDAGEYRNEDGKEYIDIYVFTTRTELVRVLAHELGHAVGLGHVDGADSIMYHKNESNSLALTSEDLSALVALCDRR